MLGAVAYNKWAPSVVLLRKLLVTFACSIFMFLLEHRWIWYMNPLRSTVMKPHGYLLLYSLKTFPTDWLCIHRCKFLFFDTELLCLVFVGGSVIYSVILQESVWLTILKGERASFLQAAVVFGLINPTYVTKLPCQMRHCTDIDWQDTWHVDFTILSVFSFKDFRKIWMCHRN